MTQLVSVTPQLIATLVQAQKYDAGLDEARVTDAARYADTARMLEALTNSVLATTASTPLLTVSIAGPRFDAAGEGLTARMQNSIEYLRGTASPLIRNPHNLSRYERKETDAALIRLRALYSHLMSAIEDQVVRDIRTARNEGAAYLINVAEIVAATVRRPKKSGGDQPAGEEDVS